jgi:8-oxo-dGTP diphosphatase
VEKPLRCSVAALVRRDSDDRFLAVLRPPDDDRLPNVWGLPAVTLTDGELPECGLRRLGLEKLGARLEPVRMIGIRVADRGDYRLVLMDLEARVIAGEPDVALATTTATRYVDQCWTDRLELLAEAAAKGSLCSQILLERAGIRYEGSG